MSTFATKSMDNSIEILLWDYVCRWKNEGFSGATTETLQFTHRDRKGTIQLKWWKQCNMLIVKAVEMQMDVPHEKGEFTQACSNVLHAHQDVIKSIRLESVSSEGYATYLKAQGWKMSGPFFTGINADLTVF